MKYKRITLALLSAAVCALAASGAPWAAQAKAGSSTAARAKHHLLVGLDDESGAMFTNRWFRRLPIKIARYGVPWNIAVTRDKTLLGWARTWLAAAARAGVQPLVSFGPPGGNAGNYIPDDRTYTRAVKAFMRDFPNVRTYTPWNEPEFPYRALGRQPGLAAAYFNTLVRACRHCTIVAGDLYLPASAGLESWVRAYKRGLRFKPVAWAIHPYDDVRTHTTGSIQVLERYVGGAQIWLDEISGVLRRGHWPFPNQSPNAANRDERFMFVLPKIFHNITRIYHYQWQAVPASPWDSALLGPGGQPRPAYWTFANAVKGKLP